ncbi:MAG: SCO family protein [Flavobacteriales bacterium]|jgi:protein SCO1/2|nr:SCO family protein [Flavobacteriales bacterium]|tara:strand:- start:12039 stop:12755 length:717 start_codon:yes stop_codon:yes gene_type:complete
MKKWLILFSILIFPYLLIQVFEKATHNILTLGYVEKSVLITDSEGNITEKNDSVKVPKFQLLNQDEKYISNIDLLGFNYIVNFFFTSCPTICPTTTLNLVELQNKIKKFDIKNFKIISVSVDPNNDNPDKMKNYANSMNIDLSNWELLTGDQEEIYNLVQEGFSLAVGQDSLAPGGVFHSSYITIVDKYGYIRTGLDKKKNTKFIYDGTLYSDVKLLMDEIQRLSITDYKDNYEITNN